MSVLSMVYITLYIRVYTVQYTIRYNGQQQCTEGNDTRRFRECALIMADIPIDRLALTGTLVQCLVGEYLFHDTHQDSRDTVSLVWGYFFVVFENRQSLLLKKKCPQNTFP